MKNYKEFFKGKKITIMGLGVLGRGLGYTKFLAECGADLIVTDLKNKEELNTSIKQLSKFKNIKYTLGGHKVEDFRGRDMIIKSAGVPLDSIYIKEAEKNNIPVEMDVSLFAKLAKDVMVIGVTGTRGKSMTTTLIHEILSKSLKDNQSPSTMLGTKKPSVFLGGNIRGVATLPLLKKVNPPTGGGDILVAELDSWQLQGFGPSSLKLRRTSDAGFSPHIAVFTSFMPDHMNYYHNDLKKYFNDKANIFKYQKEKDFLIIRPDMKKLIPKNIKSKLIVVNPKDALKYKFVVPGKYQRENLACAVAVAKVLGVSEQVIAKAVRDFKGLEGRLQYLKEIKGVKIYNDNNATTPEATMSGLEALSDAKGCIILICGGADKKLNTDELVKTMKKYCKTVILIPGSGTDNLLKQMDERQAFVQKAVDLKEAIKKALGSSKKGDIILFSPAFASFGMFKNEYDRNDQFIKIIKNLK